MRASLLLIAALTTAGCSDPSEPGLGDPCADQAPGTACTWLGLKGSEGFNGDGRPRWETQVNQVQDLVFHAGSVWLSDFNNHLVRRVGPDGTVHSVVGWTDPIFPGDGPLGGPPPGGAPGADWQIFHPTGLLVHEERIVVVAWHNHKLLYVDPESEIVTVACGGGPDGGDAGFLDGPAGEALFEQPSDVTSDGADLYIADQLNLRVRRFDAADTITTVAGSGDYGDAGDGGDATLAELAWGSGSNPNPSGGVLVHGGKLYVADTENHRIRVIDLASGIIDTFAGTGDPGYAGDGGPAELAELQSPRDLAIGPEGDLYVADTDNGAVRAIDLGTATIRTVVGTGNLGLDDGEQLPATQTQLRRPFGIAFDPDGALYVADSLNSRIVRVAR